MTDETRTGSEGAEAPDRLLGKLLGRHHRDMMVSRDNCVACHQFSPTFKDVASALRAAPPSAPDSESAPESDGGRWLRGAVVDFLKRWDDPERYHRLPAVDDLRTAVRQASEWAAPDPEGLPSVDWWKEIGEWAHDHAIYTKDRPDTVEVAALQAFLDELLTRAPLSPVEPTNPAAIGDSAGEEEGPK